MKKLILTLLLLIPSLSWGELTRMGKTSITVSEALEEGYVIISTNSVDGGSNYVHLYNKKLKRYIVCIVGIYNKEWVEHCGISKWKDYVPEGLTKLEFLEE